MQFGKYVNLEVWRGSCVCILYNLWWVHAPLSSWLSENGFKRLTRYIGQRNNALQPRHGFYPALKYVLKLNNIEQLCHKFVSIYNWAGPSTIATKAETIFQKRKSTILTAWKHALKLCNFFSLLCIFGSIFFHHRQLSAADHPGGITNFNFNQTNLRKMAASGEKAGKTLKKLV